MMTNSLKYLSPSKDAAAVSSVPLTGRVGSRGTFETTEFDSTFAAPVHAKAEKEDFVDTNFVLEKYPTSMMIANGALDGRWRAAALLAMLFI